MNALTFSPALGWPVGGAFAAVMAVLAVLEVALYVRRRGSSDETLTACIRRTVIALLVGVMALTPSVVTPTTSRAVNATDVVIAVDVTGSMAVADARYGSDEPVSRMDAAKQAVHGLTAMYPDASFAAVRFGASGTLDVPLTPDSIAIGNWADTLAVEATSVSSGSNLDAPLDELLLTLRDIREQHPDDALLLYMITDGEQTSNRTRRTFSTLRRYLDDAFVIGVGSAEGGNIPVVADGVGDSPDGAGRRDERYGAADGCHAHHRLRCLRGGLPPLEGDRNRQGTYATDAVGLAAGHGAGAAAGLGARRVAGPVEEADMSPQSRSARAPLAVRVAMVVIAVVMAAATAWAAINLYAAVSCNDAARTLEQNVSDASQDAADLEMLRIRQQQVDDQLDDMQLFSALLLPQIRHAVEGNLNTSRQLTQRTQEEIDRQQQGGTDDQQADQPIDGQDAEELLSGGGLTEEQRQRIEELLQSNQSSTPSESTETSEAEDSDATGDGNEQTEVKPW